MAEILIAEDERNVRDGLEDLFVGAGYGSLHAVLAGREIHGGSVGFHEVAALDGHGVGHGEDELVALDGADKGEAYACVAGSGLDDGGTGLEGAVALCGLYHGEGDAVFDAACGVEILQLTDDGSAEILAFVVGCQLHQRSVAHEFGELLGDHISLMFKV